MSTTKYEMETWVLPGAELGGDGRTVLADSREGPPRPPHGAFVPRWDWRRARVTVEFLDEGEGAA